MRTDRILFICLDGAEFAVFDQAVAEGLMPRFASLRENGVRGSLHPVTPGETSTFWATALTGFYPDRHGILGRHLVDAHGDGIRRPTWKDCQTAMIWEQFASAGLRVNRVAAPLGHPASAGRGVCLSERYPGAFLPGGKWSQLGESFFSSSEGKREDLREQLRELRYHPIEMTHDWVSRFIPEIATINQESDRRPAALGTALARTLSIHNAATLVIEQHPAALEIIRYPLWSDLCRSFLPYLAPKPESIDSADFELYQNVLPAACELFDQMLDRLCELCGPKTTICLVSDYGFHLDPNLRGRKGRGSLAFRPSFNPQGHFLLSGPGVAAGALIHGPCEADIAPTLLAAAGIPLTPGLDGRPWIEAFEPLLPFEVSTDADAALSRHQGRDDGNADAGLNVAQTLDYLKQQGYLDPLAKMNRAAATRVGFEQDLKRFSLLVYRERTEEAAQLARSLCKRRPRAIGLRLRLIQKLFHLGRIEDAGDLAKEAFELLNALSLEEQQREEPSIAAEARLALLRGLVAWREDRIDEAVRCFDEAGEYPAPTPLTHLLRGEAYFRIGRIASALSAFELTNNAKTSLPEAALGQARCFIALNQHEEALEPLLSVVEARPNSPQLQYLIALVLDQLGQTQTAVTTLRRCLQLKPSFEKASKLLNKLTDGF